MAGWMEFSYRYDGSFAGFLTCIFESYVRKEHPAVFCTRDDPRTSLWPEREVETDEAHARRVFDSLKKRICPEARSLVYRGFLTCLPEKERSLYDFVRLGYNTGAAVVRNLTDSRVAEVEKAVRHLENEAHLLKGFVRFTELPGLLAGEIEPKNRVLPLLRAHFCTRYSGERFVLYDRTYREALFFQPGQWAIVPLEKFSLEGPGEEERDYRRMWKRFYDTIAIEGRYNPRCRMSHMPKRYWGTMTEFQEDLGR